jgi:hypothetical protein
VIGRILILRYAVLATEKEFFVLCGPVPLAPLLIAIVVMGGTLFAMFSMEGPIPGYRLLGVPLVPIVVIVVLCALAKLVAVHRPARIRALERIERVLKDGCIDDAGLSLLRQSRGCSVQDIRELKRVSCGSHSFTFQTTQVGRREVMLKRSDRELAVELEAFCKSRAGL